MVLTKRQNCSWSISGAADQIEMRVRRLVQRTLGHAAHLAPGPAHGDLPRSLQGRRGGAPDTRGCQRLTPRVRRWETRQLLVVGGNVNPRRLAWRTSRRLRAAGAHARVASRRLAAAVRAGAAALRRSVRAAWD